MKNTQVKFFETKEEAEKEAKELKGYNNVSVETHNFGLMYGANEKTEQDVIEFFINTEKGTLRESGEVING
jgi:hypothetical protein